MSDQETSGPAGAIIDDPVSLYAATKKADELMSYCYAQLYRLPMTGLRFFTVYGPWGRPDMATWLFAEAIVTGKPIKLFNHGKMSRDFTYIDDIVAGVIACLDRPPADTGEAPPYRLYNLGNHKSEDLGRFVACLEKALGKKAKTVNLPMQRGEVLTTYADISSAQRDFGFAPKTSIEEGLQRFADWFVAYRKKQ